jgi:hypothetical protein
MTDAKTTLLVLLAIVAVAFIAFWVRAAIAAAHAEGRCAALARTYELFVGFVTDFADTLGIGSFATTTALWRARRTIPDEQIPGHAQLRTDTRCRRSRRGVHLHQSHRGRADDAAVDDRRRASRLGARCARSWRAGRAKWIRRGLGLALLAAVHGAGGAAVRRSGEAAPDLGLSGSRLVIGIAGNFAARRADDDRRRPVRARASLLVSLLGLNPAPASDHDGLVRVPDAARQRRVRAPERYSLHGGAGPHARRHPGGC